MVRKHDGILLGTFGPRFGCGGQPLPFPGWSKERLDALDREQEQSLLAQGYRLVGRSWVSPDGRVSAYF